MRDLSIPLLLGAALIDVFLGAWLSVLLRYRRNLRSSSSHVTGPKNESSVNAANNLGVQLFAIALFILAPLLHFSVLAQWALYTACTILYLCTLLRFLTLPSARAWGVSVGDLHVAAWFVFPVLTIGVSIPVGIAFAVASTQGGGRIAPDLVPQVVGVIIASLSALFAFLLGPSSAALSSARLIPVHIALILGVLVVSSTLVQILAGLGLFFPIVLAFCSIVSILWFCHEAFPPSAAFN